MKPLTNCSDTMKQKCLDIFFCDTPLYGLLIFLPDRWAAPTLSSFQLLTQVKAQTEKTKGVSRKRSVFSLDILPTKSKAGHHKNIPEIIQYTRHHETFCYAKILIKSEGAITKTFVFFVFV